MNKAQPHTLVVIAGPTAIGKTSLAVNLAEYYGTAVISADSRQFYREMSIGTARPRPEEMRDVPHYFVGHISIHDAYNAGKYESDVMALLPVLFQKNPLVIMCGGSGLFINAVCNGLDEFEEIDPQIRRRLNEEYERFGLVWLQQQVKEKDPAYFEHADRNNPHRLLRALEVCEATGKPFSSFKTGQKKERPFEVIKILLDDEREKVYERINQRTAQMMEDGWLEETRNLLPFRNLNALNTVGYKELFQYLDQKISLAEAVELIKMNTRRYAKRQLTWFRNDADYTVFKPGEEEKVKTFLDFVKSKFI